MKLKDRAVDLGKKLRLLLVECGSNCFSRKGGDLGMKRTDRKQLNDKTV